MSACPNTICIGWRQKIRSIPAPSTKFRKSTTPSTNVYGTKVDISSAERRRWPTFTAAEGGTLLIQSIADINTSLDEAKARTGEWGEATRAQLDAEQELSETVNAVFKMSGTNFESMIAYAKAYVAQGLTAIIKGCINIANWFIRMYNNSLAFRGAVNSLVNSFKLVYEIFKFVFKQLIDGFSAAGTVIEGMVTLDWDKVKKGWSDGTKALRGNVEAMARNIGANFANAYNKTVADHIKEYCDLCDKHGQEAVDDYMEFHDELDNFEEAYCGEWDSEEDFARHIVEECYDLDRIMGNLSNYFDYDAFARDLFMYDYSMGTNNNVFRVV